MKKPPFNYRNAVQWHTFDKESVNLAALMRFADGNYTTWKEFLKRLRSDDCKEIVIRLRNSGYGLDFWRPHAQKLHLDVCEFDFQKNCGIVN